MMKATNLSRWLVILIFVLLSVSGCAGSKSREPQATGKADVPADNAGKGGRNESNSYTVVSGDNLWNIAGNSSIYGDPYKWPLIYKANKSGIADADLIYPGQIFDIDRSPSTGEIGLAVNHARNRGAWSVGQVESSDTAYLSRN